VQQIATPLIFTAKRNKNMTLEQLVSGEFCPITGVGVTVLGLISNSKLGNKPPGYYYCKDDRNNETPAYKPPPVPPPPAPEKKKYSAKRKGLTDEQKKYYKELYWKKRRQKLTMYESYKLQLTQAQQQ
jgi:hypothetical protein